MRIVALSFCFAVFVTCVAPLTSLPLYTGRQTSIPPPVGTGLEPISGIASWCPFKNIFRCSEPFTLVTTSGAGIARSQWSLLSSGYPSTLPSNWIAKTVINSALNGAYDGGSYVLLFSGSGVVSVGGDAYPVASSNAKRLLFSVPSPSSTGIIVTVNSTSTTDPVLDIRVALLADEAAVSDSTSTATPNVFQTAWLAALSRFDTVFTPHWQREWYNTYDSRLPTWANRPVLATDQTQAGQYGVSHEAILALAMAASINLWVSVPWNADKAYYDGMAQLYAASSAFANNATRRLYITHSTYVGYISDVTARVAAHKTLWTAFQSAFGAQRANTQVRIVLDAQFVDSYVPYLNPQDPKYDATFARAVTAVAIPASTQAGSGGPYTTIVPSPYYYKLNPYLDDTARIAREQMWYDEEANYRNVARLAFLGYPTFSYSSGIINTVPMYNMRYNFPNSSLAAIEAQLEANLYRWELSNPNVLGDLWAEYAERWFRSGGGLFIAGKLISRGVQCAESDTGVPAFNRLQCGYLGLARSLGELATSNKFLGLTAWINRNGTYIDSLMVNQGAPAPTTCTPACVWGSCVLGACECHRGYSGATCTVFDATSVPNHCSPPDYGMNMPGMPDWEPSTAWTDMSGYARQWLFQRVVQDAPSIGWTYNSSQPLPAFRTADGYPVQLNPNDAVSTFLKRDQFHYAAGRYHLFYDGDGIITVGMDTYVDRRVRKGYIVLEVKPVKELNNGIYYSIVRTNPDDPIRNVRVVHDSMLHRFQTQPFQPLFLKMLEEYRHLRYMNVMLREDNATATSNVTWSQRPTPQFYSQTVRGMAAEHIVTLSNTLMSKPWLNIPFDATDDYVAGMARLLNASLNPLLLPVTVEYSNELWATHHIVGFLASDKAIAAGLADGSDDVKARACWAQHRSRQIWAIFAKNGVAVNRVLGGFAVSTDVVTKALACEANAASEIDFVAIAPYLGATLTGTTSLLTLDDVFGAATGALNSTATYVVNHMAAVASYKTIKVAIYEAGPSFFGGAQASDPDVTALGFRVHHDPRMQTLIAQYFAGLRQAGSTSMNLYFQGPAGSWSSYGAWGIRQFMDEDPSTSHKVKGYRAYASSFGSCSVDGATQFSTGCPNSCSGHGYCMADKTCQCYWTYNGTDCSNTYLLPDATYCNKYTCEPQGGHCAAVGATDGFSVVYCQNCSAGWIGWDCLTPSCASLNNCSWAGTCTAPSQCTCFRGRMGKDCSVDCKCNGHGYCNADATCQPDSGWTYANGQVTPQCNTPPCLAPGISDCSTTCVYGSCWNGACTCWVGWSGPTCTSKSPTGAPNANSTLGINVAGISDWSSTTEFVNYMWRSRAWFPRPANILAPSDRWSTSDNLTLTEEGYPASLPPDRVASTFAMRDVAPSTIGAGVFHVFYDGDGALEVGFDAKAIESTRAKGYFQVQYTPTTTLNNGFLLTITRTNPSNPLRNIRILPAAYPWDAYWQLRPFTDEFLADMSSYRTIRFMNWVNLGTTLTDLTTFDRAWSTRKRLYSASMATSVGANEDLMIHLCNLVGADPWFTIPHDATDEYVTSFASLILRRLRPDVALHIEHSNEVWNSNFQSYRFAVAQGRRQFGTSISDGEAAMRWHGLRSQQIFTIFKGVFGPRQYNRLNFHLGTFTLSTWHTSIAAAQITVRPVSVAVTTYFCDEDTMGGAALAQTLTAAQMLIKCAAAVGALRTSLKSQLQTAVSLGLEPYLVAYEGGVSLVQQNVLFGGYPRPGLQDTYYAVHTNSNMSAIVPSYLDDFTRSNVTMVNWFTSAAYPSVYGSWGIKDSTVQSCAAAPKCVGVRSWIAKNMNSAARRTTWSVNQYNDSNTLVVTFDAVPSLNQLSNASRLLEVALRLPVFTIYAVLDDTVATSRRAGGATAYFMIAQSNYGTSSSAGTASQLAAALSSSTFDYGLGKLTAAVDSTSTMLLPTTALPSSLVPSAPSGGYASPPAPFSGGASAGATPPPSVYLPSKSHAISVLLHALSVSTGAAALLIGLAL